MDASIQSIRGRSALAALAAVCLVLGLAGPGRSDFYVTVYEDGNTAVELTGHLTTAQMAGQTTSTLTINGSFPAGSSSTGSGDFSISNLTVTTNTGATASQAELKITGGQINFDGSGGAHTLTIVASSSYTFPPPGHYSLGSSESYTAILPPAGTSYGYQSFATQGSTPSMTPPSGGSYTASVGHTFSNVATGSGSFNETPAPTFVSTIPFTMVAVATITINNPGGSIQITGSTLASAVPEPSSIALLGLGLAGVVSIARRRRSRTTTAC